MTTYIAYIDSNGSYTPGDNSYVTSEGNVDDKTYTAQLSNAFKLNNTNYSTIYISSNGVINFTSNSGGVHSFTKESYAGIFTSGYDM